jgi:hypothetical protein
VKREFFLPPLVEAADEAGVLEACSSVQVSREDTSVSEELTAAEEVGDDGSVVVTPSLEEAAALLELGPPP